MPTKGGGGAKPKTLAETRTGRKTLQAQQEPSTIKTEPKAQTDKDEESTLQIPFSGGRSQSATEYIDSSQSETITSPIISIERHVKDVEAQTQTKLSEGLQKESTGHDVETSSSLSPRQVIAVSASKGPAAFFNLARKFLVTDKTCDLSALEGAIVSAVDAAHLLERSKLATIVRIQTSYVAVGPKRKKNTHSSTAIMPPQLLATTHSATDHGKNLSFDLQAGVFATGVPSSYIKAASSSERDHVLTQDIVGTNIAGTGVGVGRMKKSGPSSGGGKELRRARMIITVRRTDEYEKWLIDNPLQEDITVVESEKQVDEVP